jgi:hypothetical protein
MNKTLARSLPKLVRMADKPVLPQIAEAGEKPGLMILPAAIVHLNLHRL